MAILETRSLTFKKDKKINILELCSSIIGFQQNLE